MPEPSIVVSLIALGGTIIGILSNRSRGKAEARKLHAESEASISKAAVEVAGALRREMGALRRQHQEDLERLTERLRSLEERNSLYRRYIGMLITQLTGANLTPVQPPDPLPSEY